MKMSVRIKNTSSQGRGGKIYALSKNILRPIALESSNNILL
jgi:hypothetical protein